MAEKQECIVVRKIGKLICSTHHVEMIPQSVARERGLTLDQPFVDGFVCPVSGCLRSSGADVDELLDEMENG